MTVAAPDPAPTVDSRLPSLTGYRFPLAFMVLFCHAFYAAQVFDSDPLNDPMALTVPLAATAVSSFFVLSGFVLTWSARPGDHARAFWRRRAVKILPNHVVTWAVTVVFLLTAGTASPVLGATADIPSDKAIANLFLLQTWVPRLDYALSVNVVSWSISCEAFFYLVFPLLLPVFRRIPRHRLRPWAGAVAALIVLAPASTHLMRGPDADMVVPLSDAQLWLVYVFPPVRLLEFALGIVLARLVRTGQWPDLPFRKVAVLPVCVLLCTPFLPAAYLFGAATAIPMALVIPTLATADLAGRGRRLRSPLMTALGNSSFALYLIHYPVLIVARTMVGADHRFAWWTGTLLLLGVMGVCQVLAWWLYRYVETPCVRRFARAAPTPSTAPLPRTGEA
ncbi:acyltransferase family protein [Streptomyces sp. NPDC002643]